MSSYAKYGFTVNEATVVALPEDFDAISAKIRYNGKFDTLECVVSFKDGTSSRFMWDFNATIQKDGAPVPVKRLARLDDGKERWILTDRKPSVESKPAANAAKKR